VYKEALETIMNIHCLEDALAHGRLIEIKDILLNCGK